MLLVGGPIKCIITVRKHQVKFYNLHILLLDNEKKNYIYFVIFF